MRKSLLSFLIFLCMLFSSVPAFAEEVTEQRVFDYADLVSPAEEEEMQLWIEDMRENWGLDLAYVMTYDTEGKSARDYGADFYLEHGMGLGETYDGVIFVLDMTNREGQIVTCGKAIDIYTDYYIDQMWNDMKGYLSEGAYQQAFSSLYTDMKELAGEYEEYQKNPNANVSPYERESDSYLSQYSVGRSSRILPVLGIAAVFSLAVAGIGVAMMGRACKTIRPFTDGRAYLKENGYHLQIDRDTFANTHTTMMPIPKNDNNHHHRGGSWGGGSSTFSRGGRSFGGGGGKF